MQRKITLLFCHLLNMFILLFAGCEAPPVAQKKSIARITFYGGKREGLAGAQHKAIEGRSVASHPKYPFGTKIRIPQLKNYVGENFVVEDRGSAVTARKASRGKTDVVDVYIADRRKLNRLAVILPEYMEVLLP